jgi:hypothetical protein
MRTWRLRSIISGLFRSSSVIASIICHMRFSATLEVFIVSDHLGHAEELAKQRPHADLLHLIQLSPEVIDGEVLSHVNLPTLRKGQLLRETRRKTRFYFTVCLKNGPIDRPGCSLRRTRCFPLRSVAGYHDGNSPFTRRTERI